MRVPLISRIPNRASRILLCLAVALSALVMPAQAVWDWKLPPELYKTLNITKRRQLDQAAELFAKGIHPHTPAKDKRRLLKTSLLEWKKIRVQSGQSLDDSTLAYVIFMQAHSAYYAKNRFEAINTYTEVVDYFPNEIWIVVPAIHFTAEAHFDIDRTRWKVIYGSSRFFKHLGMHLVFDLISIQCRIVFR